MEPYYSKPLYSKRKEKQQHNTLANTKPELPWVAYSFDLASAPTSESWAGEVSRSLKPLPKETD